MDSQGFCCPSSHKGLLGVGFEIPSNHGGNPLDESREGAALGGMVDAAKTQEMKWKLEPDGGLAAKQSGGTQEESPEWKTAGDYLLHMPLDSSHGLVSLETNLSLKSF